MPALSDLRLLVVGASSGIGRAVAVAAGNAGSGVALAGRRRALVEAAAADAGPRARSFPADVTDPDATVRLVADAVAWLGGLDVVVYAAGRAPLGPVERTSAAEWRDLMATNVTGAALVLAACLPHLRRSGSPCAVVLTSHSVERPWPGLVPYAASKAALDALARGLRTEEPGLRILRVEVGNTATGFADGWDPDLAARSMTRWVDDGFLRHRVLAPYHVAAAVLAALAAGGPDDLRVVGAAETT